MQFINVLKTILSLLPLLIQAIQLLEQAVPDSKNGTAKLEALREIVSSAYTVSTDVTASFESIWPTIQKSVAALVGLFNTVGKFTKS